MVEGRRREKFLVELKSGQHLLIADAPAAQGGTDVAMGPHQLLEAALASCTIMTVQMYADHKGWPLKSTRARVTIDQESAEASHITREVSFEGDLTEEQRARLLEIANKCPIHKLLSSRISITTKMV